MQASAVNGEGGVFIGTMYHHNPLEGKVDEYIFLAFCLTLVALVALNNKGTKAAISALRDALKKLGKK